MLLPGVLYFLFFLFLVQVGHLGRGQYFLFLPLGPMHLLMQKYGQLLLLLSLVDVFWLSDALSTVFVCSFVQLRFHGAMKD